MSTELDSPVAAPGAEELGKLYDEEYYRTGCGPVPYTRAEPQWSPFFGSIAEHLIRAFHPKRVLDAGCALGFLVEAFWDRGVEAWGIDVSPYAIAHVRRDMQPYCSVGSLAERIPGSFDLITCIEVLEHMPEDQGLSAIGHLTKAADVILFSSTPYDLDEPTHFNVRPLVYWLQAFREHGFSPDLDFDAGFVCSHAMLFRRSEQSFPDEVLRLYANYLHKRREVIQRDGRLHGLELERAALQSEKAVLQASPSEQDVKAPYQEKIRILEEEKAANAELQGKLQTELELAASEIEQLAALRLAPPAAADSGASNEWIESVASQVRMLGLSLKTMDSRLGSMEQQNANLATSLAGIVDSKIWRTLVRGGGLLQRLFRV
jgi:SAM-dependent methyltransferase